MLPLLLAACTHAPPPPGVLLITIDTWRADHLSAEHSPRAWAMAKSGRRFSNAGTLIGFTTTAHACLMTGRLPWELGMRGNNHHGYVLAPSETTLAETYAAQGYATAAFISAWPAGSAGGLNQGFTTFDQPADGERPGETAVEGALSWLGQQSGPWFLWLHLYEPHGPYVGKSAGDAERYAEEVRHADALAARVWEPVLDGGGTVVLTADHGEVLQEERCSWQHDRSVHPAVLAVPLVIAGPGIPAEVVSDPVTIADVPALLRDERPSHPLRVAEAGRCDPDCMPCPVAGFAQKPIVAYGEDSRLVDYGDHREGDPALAPALDAVPRPVEPTETDLEKARLLGYTQ